MPLAEVDPDGNKLEIKWKSILSLQKKINNLEEKVKSRTEEIEQTSKMLDVAYKELNKSYESFIKAFSGFLNQREIEDKLTYARIKGSTKDGDGNHMEMDIYSSVC